MSRFPVGGLHQSDTQLPFSVVRRVISWREKFREAGSQGKFQSVLSHWTDTEPSHKKQCFGGSR
jgi:hypothetical protein